MRFSWKGQRAAGPGKWFSNKMKVGRLFLLVGAAWAQVLFLQDEEGHPIRGARLQLTPAGGGKPFWVVSDSLGGVQAPPGTYRIEVQAEGYLPYRETITLPASAPVVLERPAYTLADKVITGQYAPLEELRSLYPVRILTAERIQAQGALYLPQLLATELNTRLSQDPNLGTFATLQGLGGEHVKVLIDGVPVIGRVSGSVDLAQLPLAEVERVEIVEGPMSVLYGTDALGGVINLITRRSRCQWETRGRFQYEGVGVYDAGFSVAGGPLKHRLLLAGGRYYFDGWDPNPHRLRAQLWRPREQYNALLSYQWRPSDRFRLHLQAPFSDETFFNLKEPTLTPYRVYALDEYYYTRRFLPSVEVTYEASPRWRWDQQAAWMTYRRIRQVVYKDLVTLSETLVPLPGQQDSTQETLLWARGGVTYSGQKLSWQAGHEVQHTVMTGGRIQGGRAEMGDYALWGTAEWAFLPGWALRPGFRIAYNTRYRAPFLPALHVRWSPSPTFSWRIGYSRGFRAPSLREQFLYLVFTNHNIQGNPNLRPERSHHLHTNFTWSRLHKESLFRWRFSAFWNDLEDVIQLVIVDPATLFTTYYNLQRFQTLGLQPRWEMRYKALYVMAGATATWYNRQSWGWEVAAQTTYEWKGFTAAAFFKFQGRVPIFLAQEDGSVAWRWIGGYPWLDLSVGRAVWQKRLHLTAGLRNVVGVTSVQASLGGGVHTGDGVSAPVGMGRYPFLRAELHFQKGEL